MSKEQDFKFYLPIELQKSDSEDESADSWKIKGIASTPDEDLQGETVDQNGLDISLLKAGKGVFNFDHKSDPQYVLGQIEDADFVVQDGKKCLMVEGYLFKHQDAAKGIYNILKSLKKGTTNRVQLSIEGKVLNRDFSNPKAIKKARIDKVAITLSPVNPYTYADLVKSLNAPDAIEPAKDTNSDTIEISKSDLSVILDYAQKALVAGASAGAPQTKTGGAAMIPESLESKITSVTYSGKKKKKVSKEMMKSIIDACLNAHPESDAHQVIELVLKRLNE